QVRRNDLRHDMDDDDDVHLTQPTSDAPPRVGPRPAQLPAGPVEGLDIGSLVAELLSARVEEAGVQVTPGDELDVVAGSPQLMGQRGGMRCDPTLIRMGRADDGNAEQLRPWPATG